MKADFYRCPVCKAGASRADVAALEAMGGGLVCCPRDPWCWCSHPALVDGVCELCGLKPPAPEVIDAEAAPVVAPAPRMVPRETPRTDAPKAAPAPTRKKCECGERILLVKMASGALMPVNPQDGDDGNVAVRLDGDVWRGRIVAAGVRLAEDEARHMPHWATCPKADKKRRGKK